MRDKNVNIQENQSSRTPPNKRTPANKNRVYEEKNHHHPHHPDRLWLNGVLARPSCWPWGFATQICINHSRNASYAWSVTVMLYFADVQIVGDIDIPTFTISIETWKDLFLARVVSSSQESYGKCSSKFKTLANLFSKAAELPSNSPPKPIFFILHHSPLSSPMRRSVNWLYWKPSAGRQLRVVRSGEEYPNVIRIPCRLLGASFRVAWHPLSTRSNHESLLGVSKKWFIDVAWPQKPFCHLVGHFPSSFVSTRGFLHLQFWIPHWACSQIDI